MKLCCTLSLFALMASGFGLPSQTTPTGLNLLRKKPPKQTLKAKQLLEEKPKQDLLHLSISLRYADPAGMQRFVDSVSDPKSPTYRHFISPDEVGQKFGLPTTEIQKIKTFLETEGFQISLVGKNRLSILADATVGQAETAFHTKIQKFTVKPESKQDDGKRFSFTTALALPQQIAPDVIDIAGLENFTRPKPHNFSPQQLQTAYSIKPLFDNGCEGEGRTIGISNYDGFRISGEVMECDRFVLPIPGAGPGTNITVIPISGGNGRFGFQNQEGDLDIQTVIGMAPLCNLLVYDNNVPTGINDPIGVATREVDDNKADLITDSYGWNFDSDTTLAVHDLHQSMSAQGITYLCASGDTGTDDQGYPYPNIDPEVLSVGGTSLTVNSQNQRTNEVGWDNIWGAGGGGWAPSFDSFNVRPSYQLTPQFLAWRGVPDPNSAPYRLYPDVALDADPTTGYLVFIGSGFVNVGGTSGASPTTAGGLALVEQQLIDDNYLGPDAQGNYRLGRINDLLYSYNNDPEVFFDIVTGTNGLLPDGAASTAETGWDTVAGWGPIIFSGLVNKIESAPDIVGLTLDPTSVVGGGVTNGVVRLGVKVNATGATVVLESDNPDAQVPGTVIVPIGMTAAAFQVNTSGVAATETANITAISGTSSMSVQLTIQPASLIALNLNPSTVVGGNSVLGNVALNGLAPVTGLVVNLSSDTAGVSPPPSVVINNQANVANFNIATAGVDKTVTATLTATLGSKSVSAQLTIEPATLQSVSVNPLTVVGGSLLAVTGTVTLTGQAGPSGITVNLSSSDVSAASLPSSVTVANGQSSASFSVTTYQVPQTENVTITATYAGTTQTAVLNVQVFGVRTLTINPSSVVGGNSATGTVTLTDPPSGTISVALSSSGSAATVPPSVSISSGALTATFSISTAVVSSPTPVGITASLYVSKQTQTLTVEPAGIQSIVLNPSTVVGGAALASGTIVLSGPTAPGGATVTLTSSQPSVASVPGQVSIPAGASQQTFAIATAVVLSTQTPTITGTLNGTQTAVLTVVPYSLASLTINPSSVVGGLNATGTLTLSGIAPAGGIAVKVASNNANAQVPNSVTLPAGSASANFTISTSQVSSQTTATITATYASSTQAAGLVLTSISLSGLTVSPSSVVGGASATGSVTLSANALPGGVTIALHASLPDAQLPPSVTIPAGSNSVSFSIQTNRVGSTETVTVSATMGQTEKMTNLVLIGASLIGLSVTPTTVVGGSSATGVLSLTGQSPPGGFVVNLASNSSSAQVPASVTIPAGAQSGTFPIATSGVSGLAKVTISASAYSSGSLTAPLFIEPANLGSVTLTPSSVVGGSSTPVIGTVTLTGFAPAPGVTVALGSSNAGLASVPASVVIPSGASSATFRVTDALVTTTQVVTIRATAGALTSTATLTLLPYQIASLTVSPTTVLGGTSCEGTVALNAPTGPKRGPIVVKLTSSNRAASPPATVTVPIGQSSVTFAIKTSPVAATTTATLRATYKTSSAQASLTVQPPTLISLTLTPTSVKGSASTKVTGTITINAPAPSNFSVTLTSSTPAAAKPPTTVTIPANKTTATFTVTHKKVAAQTSVTITATRSGTSVTATLTVTP